ncbi:MAG TPA: GNAT family N-acetyltransferase, partial [Clostridia bacterium]|nr:GNAT family N-acetyltransferase [Clostridia bacterium]
CYHWNEALANIKGWNCSKAGAPINRKYAVEFINTGIMQGYLAYTEGKVIGWCNTNDKQAYDNVNFSLPWEDWEKGKKIKSIVCFCIAPGFRGKGVASRLLERICSDAADSRYEYIEAYPFENNNYHAYHGPTSMYEKHGFTAYKKQKALRFSAKPCGAIEPGLI